MLQTRTKVLNNELKEVFRGWYPRFPAQVAPSDFLTHSWKTSNSTFLLWRH